MSATADCASRRSDGVARLRDFGKRRSRSTDWPRVDDPRVGTLARERWAANGPTKRANHACADNATRLFAGTSKHGSDGNRTRDLRRDRPVLALTGRAGVGGDSRREQVFSPVVLRVLPGAGGGLRRPSAGSARDVTLPQSRTGATKGTPACCAKRVNHSSSESTLDELRIQGGAKRSAESHFS
jgi:hypothetical protein